MYTYFSCVNSYFYLFTILAFKDVYDEDKIFPFEGFNEQPKSGTIDVNCYILKIRFQIKLFINHRKVTNFL